MEIKTLKHDVFSEETVFSTTGEQSVDTDFTLPDYCPEIRRVLKCKVTPRISSKGINGQNLTVDGTAAIHILYTDETGGIFSFEHAVSFTKSFETGVSCEDGVIRCSVKNDFMNCRAVSVRKLEIHGAVTISVSVTKKKQTAVIADIEGDGMELLRGTAPATIPMGVGEKNLIVEEEVSIGNGQPSVGTLIRYDVTPVIEECKIISNKAMIKGRIRVYVLYTPDESTRPQNFENSFPFSQIVDIDGVNEDCECDSAVEVIFSELKPRSSSEDEIRTFLFSAKLLITACAYCDNDLPVILDAYSTSCDTKTSRGAVTFKKLKENINETFIAKKTLEFSDGAIGSVIDLWCDSQTGGYKNEGNVLSVMGTVTVCMLAFDTDGVPNYYERPIDFEYKYTLAQMPEQPECNAGVSIVNSSFTMTGSNTMEIRAELCINAAVYDSSKVDLLYDITVSDTFTRPVQDGALIVYFADPGERIWDIARRYNSSPDEIMSVNGVQGTTLSEPKSLIIPVKQ